MRLTRANPADYRNAVRRHINKTTEKCHCTTQPLNHHSYNEQFIFILEIVTVMTTQSSSSGPRLQKNIDVVANEIYNVQVEVMTTDLSSSSQFADVSIEGRNVGRCNPEPIYQWDSCIWWICPISPSQVSSSTTSLSIQLQYSSSVSGGSCTYNGQSTMAIARVTLTTGTGKLIFMFCGNSIINIVD